MHAIASLRRALALTTANQVRNRLDAIRDVLGPHLRRGPNNQILVTDEGLALLRQFQELYDSGLTMTEASDVLRTTSVSPGSIVQTVDSGFVRNQDKQDDGARDAARTLQAEITFLRSRVAELEGRLASPELAPSPPSDAWWVHLREDADVS